MNRWELSFTMPTRARY